MPDTVALVETEAWDRLDPASRGPFEQVVGQVEAEGVTVLRRADDAVVERFEQALVGVTELGSGILAWEHSWAFRDIAADHPDGLTARARRFFDTADRLGAAGHEEASAPVRRCRPPVRSSGPAWTPSCCRPRADRHRSGPATYPASRRCARPPGTRGSTSRARCWARPR
ncbi:MAG TPA: hypothetical protein VH008_08940 [Pseudonocardia sp.]|nr:hypothetical protein [Pseudonocardia sp.]